MSHVDSVCAEKTSLSHIYDTRALNRNYNWGRQVPIGKTSVASKRTLVFPKVAGGSGGALSPSSHHQGS